MRCRRCTNRTGSRKRGFQIKRITKSPIERRYEQIANQLQTLERSRKSRRDFKSDDAFEDWKEKQESKVRELNEETAILDNPSEYTELPLKTAAVERGVSLDEMSQFAREEIIEPSFFGEYRTACDELGKPKS